MLRVGCLIYLFILAFYTTYEIIQKQSWLLINMYIVFDIIHLCLTMAVLVKTHKPNARYHVTQMLCVFFEITLMAFFGAESVFPYPQTHTLYFSIPIFLIMLVFIHRAEHMMGLIIVYTSVFAVTAYVYKEPIAAGNDIRVAVATLVSSMIGCVLVSGIRHSEGLAILRLEYLSTTDTLTGIYNRQSIEQICKSYIDGGNVRRGSFALVIIDLDNFKNINDRYGHSAGDKVLSRFGETLKTLFYDEDYVGRFGGDEFIVLMRCDAGSLHKVQNKMGLLLKKTSDIRVNGVSEIITCCVGGAYVSEIDACTAAFDALFARADNALYEAKKIGKNRFIIM